MSPFIIFVIIHLLANMVYYATLFTLDIRTLKDGSRNGEEIVSLLEEEESEETFAPVPKSVVEDPDIGFRFAIPESSPAEFPVIEEADDSLQNPPQHVLFPLAEYMKENEICQSNTKGEDESVIPVAGIEESKESASISPLENEEKGFIDREEEDGLVTVKYTDMKSAPHKDELFDANSAFDASLRQPSYTITKMIEPSVSPFTRQQIMEANEIMESIKLSGNQHSRVPFSQIMCSQELREQYNLDTWDEVTRT